MKNKKKTLSFPEISFLQRGVLFFLLITVPLLMKESFYMVVSPLFSCYPVVSSGMQIDWFSYAKVLFFLYGGLVLLLLFLFRLLGKETFLPGPAGIILLLMSVYGCIAVCLSDYIWLNFAGTTHIFDGIFFFLACVITYFTAAGLCWDEKETVLLTAAVMIPLAVNFFVSLYSFSGLSPGEIDWVLALTGMGEKSFTAYTFIGNYNYSAAWGAVLGVFFLAMFLFRDREDKKFLPVFVNVSGLVFSLTVMVLSVSQGGRLTWYAGAFLTVAAALIKGLGDRKKIIFEAVTVAVVYFLCVGIIAGYLPRVGMEELDLFGGGSYEDRIEGLRGELLSDYGAETVSERDRLGSGRLYVWRETWKMIKEKPLTGYGFGSYLYEFPNLESDKLAAGFPSNNAGVMASKPHNTYLAYAFAAGIPFLLLFIVFNIFFAADFLRNLFKPSPGTDRIFFAAGAVCFACLVQMLVNDNHVANALLYWIFAGVYASHRNGGVFSSENTVDFSYREGTME